MEKEYRILSKYEAIQWIFYNNSKYVSAHYNKHYVLDYLVSKVPIEMLSLPCGWFRYRKNYITNARNSRKRAYNCIRIVQGKD